MAIYGIGTDVVQVSRVAAVMERTNGRFAEKVLGPDELRIYHARNARSQVRGLAFLATRFSVKEAFSKAIGLGMRWPMTWRALQTLNEPSGRPTVSLRRASAQSSTISISRRLLRSTSVEIG